MPICSGWEPYRAPDRCPGSHSFAHEARDRTLGSRRARTASSAARNHRRAAVSFTPGLGQPAGMDGGRAMPTVLRPRCALGATDPTGCALAPVSAELPLARQGRGSLARHAQEERDLFPFIPPMRKPPCLISKTQSSPHRRRGGGKDGQHGPEAAVAAWKRAAWIQASLAHTRGIVETAERDRVSELLDGRDAVLPMRARRSSQKVG